LAEEQDGTARLALRRIEIAIDGDAIGGGKTDGNLGLSLAGQQHQQSRMEQECSCHRLPSPAPASRQQGEKLRRARDPALICVNERTCRSP
jgi:hypothetical protein